MSYDALSGVGCPTIADFSSLLEIGFGINLALPVLREFVLLSRLSVEKKLKTVEKLAFSRAYRDDGEEVRSSFSKIRRKLISCDHENDRMITVCAIITFVFSFNCIYWLFYSPFDETCVDGWTLFLSVGVNYIPLPASLLYLNYYCNGKINSLNREIDEVLESISQ